MAALVSPRDPDPLGGQEHYTAQKSLHTGWGLHPTYLQPVGLLTYLPRWGLTLYLAGWEDQSLSQGIAPRSGAERRGRYRGEGPTSGVTSTFDQVLLLWPLSPRPSSWTFYPGGYQSWDSLGAFLLPQPRLGPWLGEPIKPNKLVSCLPKCSLLPFLEVIQSPCLHAPKIIGK